MEGKLDHIFYSALNDDSRAVNNWNVTSEGVWIGIEKRLKAEKRNRYGFLWMSLGLLEFVVFCLLLIK